MHTARHIKKLEFPGKTRQKIGAMSNQAPDTAPNMTDDGDLSQTFELRDDNLRLLFSEAAKRELDERMRAIEKGFVVLAVAALTALTAWVFRLAAADPQADTPLLQMLLRFDNTQEFVISIALIAAAILTILAPVIFGMLVVERRKCRRELNDLHAFLKRYRRD